MHQFVERLIIASRWIMAPFYLGLVVALVVLLATFAIELFRMVASIGTLSEHQVILGILSLVDMTFVGGLVIIVIFSGYENVVTRISPEQRPNWPIWLTTVDFSGLKRKLFASLAAIAAVALAKGLMKLEDTVSVTQLTWLVVINVVFIIGYMLMAIADRIIESPPRDE
ncbi:YqhA family protein [Roseomonas sp. OT10]|uniref:YqhA family protein n=1 Tax=Roseomonas cutis TaxID=2897332 RepID=UPI001E3613E2|nr:YqhA family protein [Roseomonas sp. OT10]UFN47479.1 YqhA family protein [Roseomonas sp. OT10]